MLYKSAHLLHTSVRARSSTVETCWSYSVCWRGVSAVNEARDEHNIGVFMSTACAALIVSSLTCVVQNIRREDCSFITQSTRIVKPASIYSCSNYVCTVCMCALLIVVCVQREPRWFFTDLTDVGGRRRGRWHHQCAILNARVLLKNNTQIRRRLARSSSVSSGACGNSASTLSLGAQFCWSRRRFGMIRKYVKW